MKAALFLFFFMFSVHAETTSYKSSIVGCFMHGNPELDQECKEQKVSMQILVTLYKSKREGSHENLVKTIQDRARYFLDKKEYDYLSILSLMTFPVPDQEKWLNEFRKIPGKRAPFTIIALERVKKETPRQCDSSGSKKVPFYLKEICSFSLDNVTSFLEVK